jgi:DNA gyrase/topoisomerase IV subunit B
MSYNEDSIYTPTGLEIVRMRPTEFIHSTGIEGLVHQATEIITNGIDEIALMAGRSGKIIVLLCLDTERHTYQLVVLDNGRGLPIGSLRKSYTELHSSGKFDTKAYEHSGGLFGVGAKLSCGTSRHFKAITRCRQSPLYEEGFAALYVHEGKDDQEIEMIVAPVAQTGVTVLYEPDPIVYTDIDKFAEEGAAQLLTLIQKYCFFRPLNIEFRTHPLSLPSDIWQKSIPDTERLINHHIESSHLVFSEENFDRHRWIRNYWGIQRPFALQHTIQDVFPAQDKTGSPITVRYEVRYYYVKSDQIGGRFGLLNNIPIDDFKSTHLLTVMDVTKASLVTHIKDPAIKKYFLETYRVPLYLAVNVKCPGAEPAGTTKHAFYSRPFRNVYEPSLQNQMAQPEGVAFIAALYNELAADIESKYTLAMTGNAKVKNTDRLSENLNFPDNFKDCRTTNRLSAELFLVEGKSAGSIDSRNSEYQGVYELRGKPFNGITTQEKIRESAIAIRNDDIYEDIITIMGIDPSNFDPNTMNFGRCLLMCDGDDHGAHIAALITGNLYALCPALIEAGILHVVTPPLYSLDYSNKRQKLPRVYMRDDTQLQIWLAKYVYGVAFDVGIRLKGHHTKTYYMQEHDAINFFRIILAIGEAITNLSRELVIPEDVVEQLSHITGYLETDPGQLDLKQVARSGGFDRVVYDAHGHIMIFTRGRDDHIVPLQNVLERLIQVVTPLLRLIKWKTTQIYITSKNKPVVFQDYPVSVMELYTLMKRLDNEFVTQRYKGLGSMNAGDKTRTCMDPKSRSMYSITTVGDVETIFNLLGKGDSRYRKKLLRRE